MTLADQTCVITGAARGIGFALAEALIARGAYVVLADIDEAALDAALKSLPSGRVCKAVTDVTRADSVEALATTASQSLGPIAVWINNAGVARHRWIANYSEAEIDLMLSVNLKGTILGSQAALRAMKAQRFGHIVNVISTASLRGIPGEAVYCAAKWGVRGFTQGLQEEAAAHRIRVTAVLPGGVATDFWSAATERQVPQETFLTPAQVADAIISVLEMEDTCVIRELVLRSITDCDFAVKPD